MPKHEISAYFLGTDHKPGKEPNPGVPYKNDKEVYFKIGKSKEENEKTNFIFTGPTKLDIFKPNIQSISQKGKSILSKYVEILIKNKNNDVEIKIKGHSRGGIVAKIVYQKLKAYFGSNKQVKFGPLIVLDPYAGPLNRLAKSKDTIDDVADANVNAVYSLTEGLYASPATALNANIIIFTDCSHDKTKYIAMGITKLAFGTYYFNGTQKELQEITNKLKLRTNTVEDIKLIKNKIKEYVQNNIKIIDSPIRCREALERFQKVATNRRKEIFYTRLAKINNCRYAFLVELYLKEHKQSKLAQSIMGS